jgi:hypothetical protein
MVAERGDASQTRVGEPSMPKAFSSGLLRVNRNKASAVLEDPMNVFLFCAMIFVCSFAIWAFWFVEKLRGDSAPQVVDLTAHRARR